VKLSFQYFSNISIDFNSLAISNRMKYLKAISRDQAHPAVSYVIAFLIVTYVLLYEWGIFEADILTSWVTGAKLLIPVLLLVLIPQRMPRSSAFKLFILFYLIFTIWGL